MKKKLILLSISLMLFSCGGGLKEAAKVLRNEKTNSTDEFLVKKRDPLILPPNYNELPRPNSNKAEGKNERENSIKKILDATNEENSLKDSTTSTEKTILDRIRN
tara:strand:+ start:1500 stop:1814 length:315 start_codon:yes stop_codon:yes gene_type:complete